MIYTERRNLCDPLKFRYYLFKYKWKKDWLALFYGWCKLYITYQVTQTNSWQFVGFIWIERNSLHINIALWNKVVGYKICGNMAKNLQALLYMYNISLFMGYDSTWRHSWHSSTHMHNERIIYKYSETNTTLSQKNLWLANELYALPRST